MPALSMRVFAFGGTRYTERARIGDWPADFAGTAEFEDVRSLPFGSDAVSFGCSVRGGVALILRQRQRQDDRGGYAYTVLFDPGAEIWTRFGWNAASLMLAAQRDAEMWDALLNRPERLVPSFVQARSEALVPARAAAAGRTAPTDLAAAVTGAALADAETVVRLASIHANSITAGDVAAALDAVPPALRCGRGWMMGGTPGTGHKFGCALLVHQLEDESRDDAAVVESGRLSVRALLEAADKSDALADLLERPMTEWGVAPATVRDAANALLGIASGAAVAEVRATLLDIGDHHPLQRDLREAVSRSSIDLRKDAEVSAWALRGFTHVTQIPPALARRVAAPALGRYMIDRGFEPDEATMAALELPWSAVSELWAMRIEAATAADAPALLQKALHAIQKGEREQRWAHEVIALTEACLRKTAEAGMPLHTWAKASMFGRGRDAVAPLFRDAARARVGTRIADWEADYLAYAGDNDGSWLAATHGAPALARVVDVAMPMAAGKSSRNVANQWFAALATSPARREIDLAAKLRIAEHIEGSWRRLGQLRALLDGQDVTPDAARPDDAPFLQEEFEELVQEYASGLRRPGSKPPRLDRVEQLTGAPLTVEALRKLARVMRFDPAAINWMRARGAGAEAERVVADTWRASPSLLAEQPPETMRAIAAQLRAIKSPGERVQQALTAIQNAGPQGAAMLFDDLHAHDAQTLLDLVALMVQSRRGLSQLLAYLDGNAEMRDILGRRLCGTGGWPALEKRLTAGRAG